MATLPVWVYTPYPDIGKSRLEALIACRGDWGCSNILVYGGIARGRSIKTVKRYGHLIYAEVDSEELRRVEEIGKPLALIAPEKAWNEYAVRPRVVHGVVRVLRGLLLLPAGYDETGRRLEKPEDYLEAASRIAEAIAALHAASRKTPYGVLRGGIEIMGSDAHYDIRVVKGGIHARFVYNAFAEPTVTIEGGEPHGPEFIVKAGLDKRGRPAILEVDVWAGRRVRPEALADVLARAVRAALSRVIEGVAEEKPPGKSRVEVVNARKVDVSRLEPLEDMMRAVYAWERMGIPARILRVSGEPLGLTYPAAVPHEKNYTIEYSVSHPEKTGSSHAFIDLKGGGTVGIRYSYVVARLPVDRIYVSEITEEQGARKLLAHLHAQRHSGKPGVVSISVEARRDSLDALQMLMLAAFHDIGWLDRYRPRGVLSLHAKLGGVEVVATRRPAGWEAEYRLPGGRTVKQVLSSVKDVVARLSEYARRMRAQEA